MSHYLDRNSATLKTIPRDEVEEAVKAYGSKNPFLQMREKSSEEKPI
jgi:hypothetical protein